MRELDRIKKSPEYFIKNYAKYISEDGKWMNFKSNNFNLKFIRSVNNYPHSFHISYRQSNKTTMCLYYAIWLAKYHGKEILYVTHKNYHARECNYRASQFNDKINDLLLKDSTYNENKYNLLFESGGAIHFSSYDNIDYNLDYYMIIMDELEFVESYNNVFKVFDNFETEKDSEELLKFVYVSSYFDYNHVEKLANHYKCDINIYDSDNRNPKKLEELGTKQYNLTYYPSKVKATYA